MPEPANQVSCTYTPLAPLTNAAGQSNVNGLTGFVRSGDEMFGVTTSGQVLCMNATARRPCDGQPFTANIPPSEDAAGLVPGDFLGTTTIINGRLYTASNGEEAARTTNPHPPSLTCFDTATKTPCAGWGTKVLTDAADAYIATAVFPARDAAGTVIGVCAVTGNHSIQAPTVACYDLTGAVQATPPGLAGIFPAGGAGSVVFPPLNVGAGGTLRTFFPFYTQDGANPGSTLCYDWSAQAPCTAFPTPNGHPTVNGGDTRDYGYVYTGTWLLGIGDRRYLFSMDPATGTPGC